MPKSLPKAPPTKPSEPIQPQAQVPAVYADSIVGIAIGPFISKIIFGMESSPGQPSMPSMQVAVPSNVLHAFASQVIEIMKDPQVREKLAKDHTALQESLSS